MVRLVSRVTVRTMVRVWSCQCPVLLQHQLMALLSLVQWGHASKHCCLLPVHLRAVDQGVKCDTCSMGVVGQLHL